MSSMFFVPFVPWRFDVIQCYCCQSSDWNLRMHVHTHTRIDSSSHCFASRRHVSVAQGTEQRMRWKLIKCYLFYCFLLNQTNREKKTTTVCIARYRCSLQWRGLIEWESKRKWLENVACRRNKFRCICFHSWIISNDFYRNSVLRLPFFAHTTTQINWIEALNGFKIIKINELKPYFFFLHLFHLLWWRHFLSCLFCRFNVLIYFVFFPGQMMIEQRRSNRQSICSMMI